MNKTVEFKRTSKAELMGTFTLNCHGVFLRNISYEKCSRIKLLDH